MPLRYHTLAKNLVVMDRHVTRTGTSIYKVQICHGGRNDGMWEMQ